MDLELRPAITQNVVTAQLPAPLVEAEKSRFRTFAWKRALKWVVLVVVSIFVVDAAASLLVRQRHVRQRLSARLQAAFGRPVSVDDYSFSLWDGPILEADGVLVGEDPRFGHEYFLRADSLAVRLRWLSLLRGRFELESLSLSSPTLNVVTDGTGDWNLAEWLGHPPAPVANIVGPMRVPFVPHFRKIEVSGGRINFKRGDEKLAFAFRDVGGTISTDGQQRWGLDLDATPWRAAELLQQPGTIHLAGSVGGTSSALRPAMLELAWSDASASDFVRLVTGEEPGIRGTLSISANAQTGPDGWTIQAHAAIEDVHRWDLTQRTGAGAPALSLAARMTLDLPGSTLHLTSASIDARHSNVRGSGRISWAGTPASQAPPAKAHKLIAANQTRDPVTFEVSSANIDFGDALSWLRSFRPNIPESTAVIGFARASGNISGWPLRADDLTIETTGGEITSAGLAFPVRLGEARLQYSDGAIQMLPAAITVGPPAGTPAGIFHVELPPPLKHVAKTAASAPPAGLHVSGSSANAGEVVGIANAFGWDLARGWQIAGPLHCDLHWAYAQWPWSARPVGSITVGGAGDDAASLHAPFLNLPVSAIEVRLDLKPDAERVTLASAQAFGANWTGTLDRSEADPQWQFALSTDQLAAADLDRWLNPRWRESFIDRVLPFLNSSVPSTAVPDSLRGFGKLTVGDFFAASFDFHALAGDFAINGCNIALDNASAQAFGGKVTGSLEASLLASPAYEIHARFSGIDLSAITADARPNVPAFAGNASGQADFSLKGTARNDFANSLKCKGAVDVRPATWSGISLVDSLQRTKAVTGDSSFDAAAAQFSCANGTIGLSNVVLATPRAQILASGTVDFAKRLDLEMFSVPPNVDTSAPADIALYRKNPVHVTGTLASPEFSKVASGGPPPR